MEREIVKCIEMAKTRMYVGIGYAQRRRITVIREIRELMKRSIGMMDLKSVKGWKAVGLENIKKTSFAASSFIKGGDRHLEAVTAR